MKEPHTDERRRNRASTGWWTMAARSTPLNQALAVVSLLALTIAPIVGTLAAATFIGSAIACSALRPADDGAATLRFWPILLLPLLALLSTVWSDAPERTMRAAVQLLITFLGAIAICRRLDASTTILVLFFGFLAIDLVSIPPAIRSVAAGMPVIGPFAGKNAMGYTAEIHLALATALLFDPRRHWLWRVSALASIPLAAGLTVLSQSAGAMASGVLAVGTFLILAALVKLPRPARVGLAALTLATTAVAAPFAGNGITSLNEFRENVLHKDATLTGRTYLWDYADGLSRQAPLLGHGYYAFWRQGNIEAEGLWRWGGIASRSGFNFHNAVIEMRVDIGLVGVIVLLGSCAGVLGYAICRHVLAPSVPLAFLVAMTIVFYIRSYAESGLISPFSLPTVLWIATLVQSAGPRTGRMVGTGRRGESRVLRAPRFATAPTPGQPTPAAAYRSR